jgi:hypothetical protein
MEVADDRTTIEYDCAQGTIEQKITLDRVGRFNVSGTQVPEHGGGPMRQGDRADGYPVWFAGQVNGRTMKFSVRKRASITLIGKFTLVHGVEAKLRKCR